jgi:hypothetical protein
MGDNDNLPLPELRCRGAEKSVCIYIKNPWIYEMGVGENAFLVPYITLTPLDALRVAENIAEWAERMLDEN